MKTDNPLMRNILKNILPLAVDQLPALEGLLVEHIASVPLKRGLEDFAAYVITADGGRIQATLCTFDDENNLARQLQTYTLSDFLKLLTQKTA